MAIAYANSSESHTGTAGSASQASFSWTHTPTGTPQGVLVAVMQNGSATNYIANVQYGSLNVPAVTGATANDSAGETGYTQVFFLGNNVPSGSQTITVNRTNNNTELYAAALTVTASNRPAVYEAGIQTDAGDGTLAQKSVTDGQASGTNNSLRVAALFSGLDAVAAAGANTTIAQSIDFGTKTAALAYETAVGIGARNIGFANNSTDDRAAVYLAIYDVELTTLSTTTNIISPSAPAPRIALKFRATNNTITGSLGNPTVKTRVSKSAGVIALTTTATTATRKAVIRRNVSTNTYNITAPTHSTKVSIDLRVNTNEVIAFYADGAIDPYADTSIEELVQANADKIAPYAPSVDISVGDPTPRVTLTAESNILYVSASASRTSLLIQMQVGTTSVSASSVTRTTYSIQTVQNSNITAIANTARLHRTIMVAAATVTITAAASKTHLRARLNSQTFACINPAASLTIRYTVTVSSIGITTTAGTHKVNLRVSVATNAVRLVSGDARIASLRLPMSAAQITVNAPPASTRNVVSIAATSAIIRSTAPVAIAHLVLRVNTSTISITDGSIAVHRTNRATAAVIAGTAFAVNVRTVSTRTVAASTISATTANIAIHRYVQALSAQLGITDGAITTHITLRAENSSITGVAGAIVRNASRTFPVATASISVLTGKETQTSRRTYVVASNTLRYVASLAAITRDVESEAADITITAPLVHLTFRLPYAAQAAYATADIAMGNWTPAFGSELYPMISATPVDPDTYIVSAPNAFNDTARFAVSPIDRPTANSGSVTLFLYVKKVA